MAKSPRVSPTLGVRRQAVQLAQWPRGVCPQEARPPHPRSLTVVGDAHSQNHLTAQDGGWSSSHHDTVQTARREARKAKGLPGYLPPFQERPRIPPNARCRPAALPLGEVASGPRPAKPTLGATHHEDAPVAVPVDAPELEVRLGFHGRCPGGAIDECELPKAATLADAGHPLSVHVHL